VPGRRGVRGEFGGSVPEVVPGFSELLREGVGPSSLVLDFSEWIKIIFTILSRAFRSMTIDF
jgi:hypothetical protein